MVRRSGFFTLGLIWDLLRFFLIFAFLTGNNGTAVFDGNFFILLLGISSQPAVSFLWVKMLKNPKEDCFFLFALRLPGFIVELAAVVLFFSGNLPGEGELLLFNNSIFPGGTGLLLLLFLLLTDFIFQLILLTLKRKES